MSVRNDLNRYLENWQDEVDSAAQYRTLADLETNDKIKEVYNNLAKVEEAHITFWETQLNNIHARIPERKPSWRSRFLIWTAKHVGPEWVLSTIASNERAGQNMYVKQPETHDTLMTRQEHWHTQILNQLLKVKKPGVSGSYLARIEGRHKAVGGNALRASVLGVNDGLCSNLSLVMGIAGASSESHTLILTGVAGLLAGAFSMALGEWISVKSSRELAEREIQIEAEELKLNPESEGNELKLIYEAKGLSPQEAMELSRQMIQDQGKALDTLTREELGIDPESLGGSANEAAAFSFVLFAVGAIIPVFPFFFLSSGWGLIVSMVASGLALFSFGALITVFTGRSVWISGGRQLILGGLAAGITYFLGHIIGANLG